MKRVLFSFILAMAFFTFTKAQYLVVKIPTTETHTYKDNENFYGKESDID